MTIVLDILIASGLLLVAAALLLIYPPAALLFVGASMVAIGLGGWRRVERSKEDKTKRKAPV